MNLRQVQDKDIKIALMNFITEKRLVKEFIVHLKLRQQKNMLEMFLERGAISRQQFEKSLHDMTEKMGYGDRPEDKDTGRIV